MKNLPCAPAVSVNRTSHCFLTLTALRSMRQKRTLISPALAPASGSGSTRAVCTIRQEHGAGTHLHHHQNVTFYQLERENKSHHGPSGSRQRRIRRRRPQPPRTPRQPTPTRGASEPSSQTRVSPGDTGMLPRGHTAPRAQELSPRGTSQRPRTPTPPLGRVPSRLKGRAAVASTCDPAGVAGPDALPLHPPPLGRKSTAGRTAPLRPPPTTDAPSSCRGHPAAYLPWPCAAAGLVQGSGTLRSSWAPTACVCE